MATRSKSRGQQDTTRTITVEQPPSKQRKISEIAPTSSSTELNSKMKTPLTIPTKVADIFETLEYGPAPESSAAADKWLDEHDRAFGHFIHGQWVKPEGRKTYTTRNPATGATLATTVQGEQEDVDAAISAARTAFESWSKLPGHVRARHLYSIARHIQKHMRLFAVLESMDNGKPIRESRDADVPLVARHLYHHSGWAQLMNTEMNGLSCSGDGKYSCIETSNIYKAISSAVC
jgi:aldehyde dehydrogenase (NAD+)